MKKIIALLPILALSSPVQADTAYGALGNFDTVNDTGGTCTGFEIEIDDAHSKDIGGTYDYNHYGVPTITEDDTDPLHPKVFIRYEALNPSGTTTGFTNPAAPGAIQPTMGHQCTNPSVNLGCEHFGVGIFSQTYTAVKYNWLVKDSTGKNVIGPAVTVNTPVWNYVPPVPAAPGQVFIPAQVVPALPAPVLPQQSVQMEFGAPSWVKAIKTTTHNSNHLKLEQLVGDDNIKKGAPDWANGEPTEVETEFYLVQTDSQSGGKAEFSSGAADQLGDGSESVTRRYEFYAYAAPGSIDGESGEAMCDTVAADGIHGVNPTGSNSVTVTDAAGNDHQFDCAAAVVVGDYKGAQMAQASGIMPLDLISSIQDINQYDGFPQRKMPNGGNTPYATNVVANTGSLPKGLVLDSPTGILSGTPSKVGIYNFSATVTDTANSATKYVGGTVTKPYTVRVTGPGDVDGNFAIDSTDLASIKAKYGQATVARDPADVDGNLVINMTDYRKAAALCNKPHCAP